MLGIASKLLNVFCHPFQSERTLLGSRDVKVTTVEYLANLHLSPAMSSL